MRKHSKPDPTRITMPPGSRPYVKRDALDGARQAMGIPPKSKGKKGC